VCATIVVATHNDRLAAAMGRTLRLALGQLHPDGVREPRRPTLAGGTP